MTAKQKQTVKSDQKPDAKKPSKERPKDLKAKDEKADDVKGGRMSSWSDRRLKTDIRPL